MLDFRSASADDVETIVAMLADDPLGAQREDPSLPLAPEYGEAFRAIAADPNNELLVAERETEIVGFLQITFIPYLTHQGSWRALIEGVRVRTSSRSEGIGEALVQEAIERARQRGCRIVQLTSDKQRPRAIAFYRRLGFVDSHEGMKLALG